jgi:hypothetical protein
MKGVAQVASENVHSSDESGVRARVVRGGGNATRVGQAAFDEESPLKPKEWGSRLVCCRKRQPLLPPRTPSSRRDSFLCHLKVCGFCGPDDPGIRRRAFRGENCFSGRCGGTGSLRCGRDDSGRWRLGEFCHFSKNARSGGGVIKVPRTGVSAPHERCVPTGAHRKRRGGGADSEKNPQSGQRKA